MSDKFAAARHPEKEKNGWRQQILHSSFFILHFFLYLCTQIH